MSYHCKNTMQKNLDIETANSQILLASIRSGYCQHLIQLNDFCC